MALGLVAAIVAREFIEVASLLEDLVDSVPPALRSIVAREFIEVASLLEDLVESAPSALRSLPTSSSARRPDGAKQ